MSTKGLKPPGPSEARDEAQMAPIESKPAVESQPPAPKISPRFAFLIPVAIGALVFFLLNQTAKKPEPVEVSEVVRVLRVIEARQMDVVPRVIGYGTAQPGQIWQAVAEVRGRILETHPDLASGAVIEKGTVLVTLDERDYELALAANLASIEQIKAQQAELAAQEINAKASLEIEERSLELAEESLKRRQNLAAQDAIARDVVAAEERTVLAQRQSVQSLRNTLVLIPSQQEGLKANLKSAEAQWEQTRRDLERVIIKAPFACRLGKVTLEKDQFVAAGQVLFEAYGVMVTEVEAPFPPERLGPFLSRIKPGTNRVEEASAMEILRDMIKVSAEVRVSGFPQLDPWPARFDRFRESVDPQTRTIGIVVAVDKAHEMVIPGRRPPLTKDMFCEVELKATEPIRTIVLPQSALSGQAVYVVTQENRLQKREISPGFRQGTFVTIESGLEPSERVLVAEPIPAIEGMLIEPVVDDELMERLKAEARGEGDLK